MRRSLELLAAAALLAAPTGGWAQPQRPPEATPEAAAAGAAACRGLPNDAAAAAERLIALGWERATAPNAAADAPPLPIFGRDRAILFLAPADASQGRGTGCMVVATLARSVRWRDLLAAATAAFGQTPEIATRNGQADWRLDGRYHVMLMHQTGRDPRATFIIAPVGNPQ
ncbi:MAG: hypothetical protein QOD42_513 [Sphingomonadales bacterium]|nr:hypothetical protein [Sphingomonadales bacterium]